MQLNYIINDIDREITRSKTELVFLEQRKQSLEKLLIKYPDAHYEHNAVCVDNLWNKITCMRVAWNGRHYYTAQINVRFSIGKKEERECEEKLYTYPYNNAIANISIIPTQRGQPRTREITILNYSNIIPNECPKRKDFIKRIRNYLLNNIIKQNMVINNQSYNIDEFNKLIMLR